MKCLRCKRPLKNKKSQLIGYGRTCLSKIKKPLQSRSLLEFVKEKKIIEKKKTEIVL